MPQGSHLGPILFLIFINSVVDQFKKCKFLLYADDLKLFCSIKSISDCVAVQEDLNNLVKWCNLNGLEINVSKCKVMRFFKCKTPVVLPYSIENVKLKSVDHFNDLGVTF